MGARTNIMAQLGVKLAVSLLCDCGGSEVVAAAAAAAVTAAGAVVT